MMQPSDELLPDSAAQRPSIPEALRGALRSDHAGETGAVFIYRGIMACSRNQDVRRFAREHLATEQSHLTLMDSLVPPAQRSRLLPLWRLAGWMTGALPAMVGARAVYRTVDAVETFVDQHYAQQLDQIADEPEYAALASLIERCRMDELQHRDDARARLSDPSAIGSLWASVVALGSRWGVALASRF